MPCSRCGKLLYRTSSSLPEGRATCRECRRAQPEPYRSKGPVLARPCLTCGNQLVGDVRSRFCSHACAFPKRTCEVCQSPYRTSHATQRTCGRECGKWIRFPTSCPVNWDRCLVCQRYYTKRAGNGHGYGVCSLGCKAEAQVVLTKPSKPAWQPVEQVCPRCGNRFTNIYTSVAVHCSKRCTRKATKIRRRVREHATYGEWSWSDFMRVARKFNYCCAYCGQKPERLDPDDVVPLSKGGPNIIGNLLPVCAPCNSDKRDSSLDEWTERLANAGLTRATSWAPEDKRYHHLSVLVS